MDDHLKEALDIVKAQASVRIMSEDEIISMVRRLSSDIKNVAEGEGCVEELASSDVQSDPRKSIKEKSITCMECGKTFKILTRKHLSPAIILTLPNTAKSGASRRIPRWSARAFSASAARR